MNDARWSRRAAMRLAAGTAATAMLGGSRVAHAAPPTRSKHDIVPPLPSGHLRPGPLGLGRSPVIIPSGVRPAGIRIDAAGVDAPIEIVQIVDGVMQNPSGPWSVAWYEQTAALGQFGNAVMSGHVDYYTVGPAVFWNLRDLVPGDEIVATGEDGTPFTYAVEWTENYPVDALTPEIIADIVGVTKRESLTLITCTGEFNSTTAEYNQRYVVRAKRLAG